MQIIDDIIQSTLDQILTKYDEQRYPSQSVSKVIDSLQ